MKIVGEDDKRKIVCACGYRESYAAFEKRKKEERGAMSKREVEAYIDKLDNKQESKNNPFAARKGMKFDKK